MRKLYCVNKAIPTLPINIEDAARSEIEIERALQVSSYVHMQLSWTYIEASFLIVILLIIHSGMQAGEQLVRVNQDTRLNYRVLDMRTHAVQSTFRIQSQVENVSANCFYSLRDSPFSLHHLHTRLFECASWSLGSLYVIMLKC